MSSSLLQLAPLKNCGVCYFFICLWYYIWALLLRLELIRPSLFPDITFIIANRETIIQLSNSIGCKRTIRRPPTGLIHITLPYLLCKDFCNLTNPLLMCRANPLHLAPIKTLCHPHSPFLPLNLFMIFTYGHRFGT